MSDYIEFPDGFKMHRNAKVLAYRHYRMKSDSIDRVLMTYDVGGKIEKEGLEGLTLNEFEALIGQQEPKRAASAEDFVSLPDGSFLATSAEILRIEKNNLHWNDGSGRRGGSTLYWSDRWSDRSYKHFDGVSPDELMAYVCDLPVCNAMSKPRKPWWMEGSEYDLRTRR